MKLNRKGFMLAEVTVVSALAITVIVAMYAASSRMITAYETRENYYNVDTIYATGYIYNYLIDSLEINKNGYINDYSGCVYLKKAGENAGDSYINQIVAKYDLEQVIFIKGESIDVLISNSANKTMKNYLNNYLKNNVEENKYYLVVERKADNNYYYYYAEM